MSNEDERDMTEERYNASLCPSCGVSPCAMPRAWHHLEEVAREVGESAGKDAAGWWEQDAIGGRTTGDSRPTAQRVLTGIDDGDPEVLDALPALDLSGEWADGPTEASVLDAIENGCPTYPNQDAYESLRTERLWQREDDGERATQASELLSALVDVYRDAYDMAVTDEVARMCRELLDVPA